MWLRIKAMAEAWIKVRAGLKNHPKVVRISSAICPQNVQALSKTFSVVGGLHAVWCVFDEFSVDGKLAGYSLAALDETIGWPGFSGAMVDVGWLTVTPEGIECPEFLTHNGASAKRRAMDAQRKQDVRNLSAIEADIPRTKSGLEKEKEKDLSKSKSIRRFAGAIAPPPSAQKDHSHGINGNGSTPPPTAMPPPPDTPSPSATDADARPSVDDVLALWHHAMPELPVVKKLTTARRTAIAARIRQDLPTEKHWQRYFGYIRTRPFLMGLMPPANGHSRAFRPTLLWFCNAENFAKISEGFYDA
jgi:hypothetical protein